jgi:UDP-3-O-[3-hydroxymyristoyl] glucosamine N-acyltransferase
MVRLGEIAKALGAEFTGDANVLVGGINHPAIASPDEMALAMEAEAFAALAGSRARTAIVQRGKTARDDLAGTIYTDYPRYALAGLTKLFARPPHAPAGIHPLAAIDPTAQIATPTSIGPFVQIGAGARILQHNASIGADGFSFAIPEPGNAPPPGQPPIQRIASLGTVILGDDVEVGANSCIDRGTIEATKIGNGTKIDNLVMVGHNTQIGRSCLIAGCVGISGSCRIGDGVILAGGVGVADHLRIGDGAVVLAGAQVGGSRVAPGAVVFGYPAIPRDKFMEQLKHLYRLKRLFADVALLKARLNLGPEAGNAP